MSVHAFASRGRRFPSAVVVRAARACLVSLAAVIGHASVGTTSAQGQAASGGSPATAPGGAASGVHPSHADAIKAIVVSRSNTPESIIALITAQESGESAIQLIAARSLASRTPATLKPHVAAMLRCVETESGGIATSILRESPRGLLIKAVAACGPDAADAAIPVLKKLLLPPAKPLPPYELSAAVRALPKLGPKGVTALLEVSQTISAMDDRQRLAAANLCQAICQTVMAEGEACVSVAPEIAKWLGGPPVPTKYALIALASLGKSAAATAPAVQALVDAVAVGGRRNPNAQIARVALERLAGKLPPPLKVAPAWESARGPAPVAADKLRDQQMLRYLLVASDAEDVPATSWMWGTQSNAQMVGRARAWAVLGDWKTALEVSPTSHAVDIFLSAAVGKAQAGNLQEAAVLLERAELFNFDQSGNQHGIEVGRIAGLYYRTGDVEKAVSLIGSRETGRELVTEALRRGDLAAVEKFNGAMPPSPQGQLQTDGTATDLAYALLRAGKKEEAAQQLLKALPQHTVDTLPSVLATLVELGKKDDVQALIESKKKQPSQFGIDESAMLVRRLIPELIAANHVDMALKLVAEYDHQGPGNTSGDEMAIQLRIATVLQLMQSPQNQASTTGLIKEANAKVIGRGADGIDVGLKTVQTLASFNACVGTVGDARAVLDAMTTTAAAWPDGTSSRDETLAALARDFIWLGDAAKAGAVAATIKNPQRRTATEAAIKLGHRGITLAQLQASVVQLAAAGQWQLAYSAISSRQIPVATQEPVSNVARLRRAGNAIGVLRSFGGSGPRATLIWAIDDAGRSPKWAEAADVVSGRPDGRYLLRRLAVARASTGDAANARLILARAESWKPPAGLPAATPPVRSRGGKVQEFDPAEVARIEKLIAEVRVCIALGDRAGAFKLMRSGFPPGKPWPAIGDVDLAGYASVRSIAETWTLTGDAASAWAYAQSLDRQQDHTKEFPVGIANALQFRLTGEWPKRAGDDSRDDFAR